MRSIDWRLVLQFWKGRIKSWKQSWLNCRLCRGPKQRLPVPPKEGSTTVWRTLQAGNLMEWVVSAAEHWDRATLRREQLADSDVAQILLQLEAGQHPNWKDKADCSPMYKSCWALVVWVDMLECHWVSASERMKTSQIVLPWSKVQEVVAELQREASGGHLGVKKTLDMISQCNCWLHLWSDVDRWCCCCYICTAIQGSKARSWVMMLQHDIESPCKELQ
jgi:hypothetical protein